MKYLACWEAASKVAFGVHGDVWMVALVGKEWRHTCGGVRSVVVSEFSKWKEIQPVVLLVVDEDTEVLFKSLVDTLCLTIAFGVVSGGEV